MKGKLLYIGLFCVLANSHTLIAQDVVADTALLSATLKKAGSFRSSGVFDSARAYYMKSYHLARTLHDTLRAGNSLIGVGISYDKTGKYQKALEYYFMALKVYDTLQNQIKIGGTLKNIGNTYRVLEDFPKAEKFLNQALEIQEKAGDSARIATVINDLGNYYLDREDYPKAFSKYNEVITSYRNHADADVLAFAHNNIGIVYSELKSYARSARHYDTSLQLMQTRDDSYGTALVLGNMADLQYKLGNYTLSLKYQAENIRIGKAIHSDDLLLSGYGNMARTYKQLGNYTEAFHFQDEMMKIKDSIYKKEAAKSYAEMEAKYQNEVNQKENALLQQRNEIMDYQLSIAERTRYFLFAVISLIVILAGLIYRAYRTKKKTSETLHTYNLKLNEANQSKAKLLSIISHDLRSPISSLFHYLQLQKSKEPSYHNEAANQKVIHSADHLLEVMEDLLIWSKSQMETFEPSWEMVNASELLEEIAALNKPFAENKNISLNTRLEHDFKFNTDLNFMKIILRNLAGNAIKFTPSGGSVILTANKGGDSISFSVQDDGPGIPETQLNGVFEWNGIRSDSSGLGLKLVKEFTEKLNGQLSVQNLQPHGTEFLIRFPIQRPVKSTEKVRTKTEA
ncbi:MAG TPA: tetratricopeptide repeat-containing sensor histidine kinase [Chitinophagaceae bacterium]|nr:tetratricopeptide repeat-containing sensor histidine kinase [Chitinophagaceae bacterium]